MSAPEQAGLTRSAVARQLGCSIASVRRLEASGKLHFTQSRLGTHIFDMAEVLELKLARQRRKVARSPRAPRYAGDDRPLGAIMKELFRAFEIHLRNSQMDLREIVVQLEVEPRLVYSAYAEWLANELDPLARAESQARHEHDLSRMRERLGLE